MSIRINQSGRKGVSGRTGGFSSLSSGSSFKTRTSSTSGAPQWNAPITAVSINKSLLAPLNLEIDPSIQAVRTQEKNQIKTLNNRFATFIDKVRFLEQQNKMLEIKWKLLDEQTSEASQIDPMFNAYIANLTRQLTQINNDKDRLDLENNCAHKLVEDYKTKYEEEINLRNVAENDFVLLKKDVDAGYLSKMNLEDIVSSVAEEVTFLKSLYEEELRELHANMQDTSVVVQMDNSRALDMDQIVAEVKVQYENIAARSREEAEGWYKTKFDQMSAQADQFGSELRSSKGEIAELNRLIGRLQNEVQAAKEQCGTLEAQVAEADQRGEAAVRDAKATIRDLEVALQRTKQDMARQVRDYQDLMNVKLGLDIEISTYRKLLEGEEDRFGQQSITNIHTVPNLSPRVTNYQPSKSSAPILIKTVETHDSTISYRSK